MSEFIDGDNVTITGTIIKVLGYNSYIVSLDDIDEVYLQLTNKQLEFDEVNSTKEEVIKYLNRK